MEINVNRITLCEYRTPASTNLVVEAKDTPRGKDLYLQGVCVEAETKNENDRIYPLTEISKAVESLQRKINEHGGVLGEADHPTDLKINLDRVSHTIVKMWMSGNQGHGKLKIIPTPMGNLVKVMLESDVKLGVSSRGAGDVDHNGRVSDYEIVTIDVVAQPSAPHAYPKPLYESLMNMKGGYKLWTYLQNNPTPQLDRYFGNEIVSYIKQLNLR